MTSRRSGWRDLEHTMTCQLDQLARDHRLRQLVPLTPEIESPLIAGQIDLTHNDYLGLRVNQLFQTRARQATTYLSVGAGASRLLGGEHPIFGQLESAFSDFKGVPSSLYFSSGYAANEAVATCLSLDDVAFFSDQLNHASIIDGLKLGRLPKDRRMIYPHLDVTSLEKLLAQSDAKINIIYTESVFSMDGDVAPLRELYELCQRYRGVLVVDEAHALGVYGDQGQGLIADKLGDYDEIISINTCGKALGCHGAVVCGPEWFRQILINRARSFIYSTAPSPWVAAALIESIALVRSMAKERAHLLASAESLRAALHKIGLCTAGSVTHIVPIVVGSDSDALHLQTELSRRAILAKAIRPPTVPEGACRIRLSLNSRLTAAHIDQIILACREGVSG